LKIHSFTFNPFQENTYILFDETGQCVIVDPGCYSPDEKDELISFITSEKLQPVLLLNTHCHIDHCTGNKFIKDKFNIPFLMNEHDLVVLHSAPEVGRMYGIPIEPSPEPDNFLLQDDEVKFGNTVLKVIFTPGHSPGSVSFYNCKEKVLLSGDVLFQGSIGRYDLPGGDYEILMQSITNKLFQLPDETKVFSGHGGVTTIGKEKRSNPFVLEYMS